MSSLRLAKIAAAMVRLIGEPFADASAPEGPTCSCPSCEEAWRRNQVVAEKKAAVTAGRQKVGLGSS